MIIFKKVSGWDVQRKWLEYFLLMIIVVEDLMEIVVNLYEKFCFKCHEMYFLHFVKFKRVNGDMKLLQKSNLSQFI